MYVYVTTTAVLYFGDHKPSQKLVYYLNAQSWSNIKKLFRAYKFGPTPSQEKPEHWRKTQLITSSNYMTKKQQKIQFNM